MNKLPERLGNYRLARLIHTGAQTEVWQAMSVDTNQPRAVKVQSLKYHSSADIAKRLRNEYAISQNRHQNIVRTLDCDVERGITYLGMERLGGKSLRQLMAEKDLSFIQVNLPLIMDQLCAGLSHLHQAGWVYGGLKPGHLLLDSRCHLLLVDLSHCLPMRKGLRLGASASKLSGSPYYVSPEQIQRQATDGRSDIYSLGCLLYELIQGHVPFTGASISELLHKHTQSVTPRITSKSKYRNDAMGELITWMMSKHPDQRPEKMLIVRHELRRIFEQADPVQWQTNVYPLLTSSDEPMSKSAPSLPSQREQHKYNKPRAKTSPRLQLWQQISLGIRGRASRWIKKRSVQVLLGIAAVCCFIWLLQPPTYNAEQRLVNELRQIVQRLENSTQMPRGDDLSSVVQQIKQQSDQFFTEYQKQIPDASPEQQFQMELKWATLVLTDAVSEISDLQQVDGQQFVRLQRHLSNAERQLLQYRDQHYDFGPSGLMRLYDSDLFFWVIVGADLLGVVWIVKLTLSRRKSFGQTNP